METPRSHNMKSDPPISENQADLEFEKSLSQDSVEDVWDNGRVIILEDDGSYDD